MTDSDPAKQKADSDFLFLKALIGFAKVNNWRVVVSGGYGMDFFLNKLTRLHGDLDVIIYGQEKRPSAIKKLSKFVKSFFPEPQITTKQETFYVEFDVHAPGFVANMYFVETEDNPFVNLNRVRKLDGEIVTNSEDDFPKPVKGKIGSLEVEVQDQNAHLADILIKRESNPGPNRRDQDIVKLRQVTDPKKLLHF